MMSTRLETIRAEAEDAFRSQLTLWVRVQPYARRWIRQAGENAVRQASGLPITQCPHGEKDGCLMCGDPTDPLTNRTDEVYL